MVSKLYGEWVTWFFPIIHYGIGAGVQLIRQGLVTKMGLQNHKIKLKR